MSATKRSYEEREDIKRNEMFTSFLEKKCFEENPQVLDDDMSDFFDSWLEGLDAQELIDYGNEAISEIYFQIPSEEIL